MEIQRGTTYQGLEWALHNPGLLERGELIQRFLIRRDLLDELVKQLRSQPTGAGLQHIICIGQRGMGKTTLLLRLCYYVEDDPDLSAAWEPVLFAEEQYSIGDLADLWLQTLRNLADRKRRPELSRRAEELLEKKLTPEGLADDAYQDLVRYCDTSGKRLVLFVDNINTVLARLEEQQAHRLRQILMTDGHILMMGAASTYFAEITDYDQPFYDFFRIFRLDGLDDQQLEDFLRELARTSQGVDGQRVLATLDRQPERVRLIRRLTGGNPRIAVLIYRLLAESPDGEIRRDLERLLDQITPFYKHQVESLPAQQQRIFDAIARHWHPVEAGQLAHQLRLPSSTISAQIGRMVEAGYVEQAGGTSKQRTYQVAERLYNIYYLMRFSRPGRQRLQWLIQFLKSLYQQDDLSMLARELLQGWQHAPDQKKSLDRAAWLGCIVQAIEDDGQRTYLLKDVMGFAKSQQIDRLMEDIIDPVYLTGSGPPVSEARDGRTVDGNASPTRVAALSMFHQGLAFRNDKDFEQARSAFQAAVESDPSFAEGWNNLGLSYVSLGDLEHAKEALEQALKLEPTKAPPWNNLGIVLGKQGRLEDAESAFKKAIACDPSLVASWSNLGGDYLGQKKLAEAHAAFQKSIELDPSFAEGWHWVGVALARQGELQQAEEAFRKAVELAPDSAASWSNLARAYRLRNKFVEAQGALEKAVELDPSSTADWFRLGSAYLEQGSFTQARSAFQEATKRDPRSVEGWHQLGVAFAELSQLQQAEEAFRKAIELAPGSAASWSNLARAYLLQNKLIEAQGALQKAVELEPSSVNTWNIFGQYYLMTGKQEPALEAFQKVVELAPSWPHGWLIVGALFMELGKPEQAQPAFEKAIELDPSLTGAWRILGLLLIDEGKLTEARALYERAVARHDDPELWSDLARSGLLLGPDSWGSAEDSARQGLASAPDNPSLLLTQAMILGAQGRWPQAIGTADQVLRCSTSETLEQIQPRFLDFSILAAADQRSQEVRALIDAHPELELAERWLPLRVAMEAVGDGDRGRLLKLAPEVRSAAEDVLREIESLSTDRMALSQWLTRRHHQQRQVTILLE